MPQGEVIPSLVVSEVTRPGLAIPSDVSAETPAVAAKTPTEAPSPAAEPTAHENTFQQLTLSVSQLHAKGSPQEDGAIIEELFTGRDLRQGLHLVDSADPHKDTAYFGELHGRRVFVKFNGDEREMRILLKTHHVAIPDNISIPRLLGTGSSDTDLMAIDPNRIADHKRILGRNKLYREFILATEAAPLNAVHIEDIDRAHFHPIALADWENLKAAIVALHDAGILHLDLMGNILVTQRDGRTFFHIIDFGLGNDQPGTDFFRINLGVDFAALKHLGIILKGRSMVKRPRLIDRLSAFVSRLRKTAAKAP